MGPQLASAPGGEYDRIAALAVETAHGVAFSCMAPAVTPASLPRPAASPPMTRLTAATAAVAIPRSSTSRRWTSGAAAPDRRACRRAAAACWLAQSLMAASSDRTEPEPASSGVQANANTMSPRCSTGPNGSAALAGTMNDLLGRLQRALARQRAFVADASYELRTPLAVLQGELELAARPGRDRQELAAAVGNASAEARQLARLTDHLLLLAKSDEDRLSLQLKRADAWSLLVRSSRFAGSRAADGVTCRVDVPPGLDADRIRQAVDNLVANALRFAPAGSVVELAAWADGTDLIIEVRDRGPGFPAGFLPHAFGRFRRPDDGPVTW